MDWELLQNCSVSFTSSALARFHFCKAFSNQWYTDAQAHKFNTSLDPVCRCCHLSNETISHVFPCPSRVTVHRKYQVSITRILWLYQIDGSLLQALEIGVRGDFQWRGDMEGPEIYQQIHHFYTDTNGMEEAKHAFASQTLLGWEDAL